MTKYFINWEADEHLWPIDSKEQAALGVKRRLPNIIDLNGI